MYDLSKFDEAFKKAIKLFPQDIEYENGVLVQTGEMTVYMSKEGYVEFQKEVIKELKKSIQTP